MPKTLEAEKSGIGSVREGGGGIGAPSRRPGAASAIADARDRMTFRDSLPRAGRRRWRSAACAAAAAAAVLAWAWWAGPGWSQSSPPRAFSETYGDWVVRCSSDGEERRCAMEQRFFWRDEESGQNRPLLTVTLTPTARGGMEVTVLAPFGLLFEHGLRLSADQHEGTVLSFHTCFPDGCVARGVLDPDVVWSFRAGAVLHLEADPAAGGDPFHLKGSLGGFGDARERLLGETGVR